MLRDSSDFCHVLELGSRHGLALATRLNRQHCKKYDNMNAGKVEPSHWTIRALPSLPPGVRVSRLTFVAVVVLHKNADLSGIQPPVYLSLPFVSLSC